MNSSLPVDANGTYDFSKAPEKVWSYAPCGFYATHPGSAQLMTNGNTLICHGTSGTFYEVDSDKNIVWKYISPVMGSGIIKQGKSTGGGSIGLLPTMRFRTYRYAPDYAAFDDKDMTPVPTLEDDTTSVSFSGDAHIPGEFSLTSYTNSSNPASAAMITVTIPQNTDVTVKIYNAGGREVATLVNQYLSAERIAIRGMPMSLHKAFTSSDSLRKSIRQLTGWY